MSSAYVTKFGLPKIVCYVPASKLIIVLKLLHIASANLQFFDS